MRAIIGEFLAQGRGGGEKARMATHDNANIDAGQRRIVEIDAHERLGHIARSRGKARRVVVLDQIVVDGFRNVDAAQVVAGLARFIVDDANGVRGIVAAGVKEIADLVRPQDLEDLLAILQIRLVARRAKR
jgi:hypothetical protein